MSDVEFAAYVAGFTDGEGYVGLAKNRLGKEADTRVTLANCNREVLEFIQERLGYGSIRSQQQKAHWRKKYTLNIASHDDVRSFLLMIQPYLIVKREIATTVLAHIEDRMEQWRIAAIDKSLRWNSALAMAGEGLSRSDIMKALKCSSQWISLVCRGHMWPSTRGATARKRKRDARGLFVRISPHNA
jgi:hypothetical protein